MAKLSRYPTRDEVDKIRDRSGLGALLKTTGDAQFVVVGVGHEPADLLPDPAAAGRRLEGTTIVLEPFDRNEALEFVARAETVHPGRVRFHSRFAEALADATAGSPWKMQLLAMRATLHALAREPDGVVTVDVDDLEAAAKAR